jgi:hypothetical protein
LTGYVQACRNAQGKYYSLVIVSLRIDIGRGSFILLQVLVPLLVNTWMGSSFVGFTLRLGKNPNPDDVVEETNYYCFFVMATESLFYSFRSNIIII